MNLFYNPNDLRLRAGWRLLIQWIIMVTIVSLTAIMFQSAMNRHFTMILTLGAAATLSVWFSIRFLDRRNVASYGLTLNSLWRREWGYGLLMGAGAMALIFLFEWSMGWVKVTGYGWNRVSQTPYIVHMSAYVLSTMFVGFYEEFMFRGYQITNLFEGFHGKKISRKGAAVLAVAVSSIIFGMMHVANPDSNWMSTVNIMAAGVMLALPFILTGRLSMSIGIHMAWNFFQGGVFGFAVSGLPFRYSILQITHNGPLLWTGGFFGPEAGFAGVLGILLLIVVQLLYIKRLRGKSNSDNEPVVAINSIFVADNKREYDPL